MKVNINTQNNIGNSPLHNAVQLGRSDNVKYLLKKIKKLKLDQQNKHDNTPLHIAMVKGYLDISIMLMDAGASQKKKNIYSQTAEQTAVEHDVLILTKFFINRQKYIDFKDLFVRYFRQIDPVLYLHVLKRANQEKRAMLINQQTRENIKLRISEIYFPEKDIFEQSLNCLVDAKFNWIFSGENRGIYVYSPTENRAFQYRISLPRDSEGKLIVPPDKKYITNGLEAFYEKDLPTLLKDDRSKSPN